MVEMDDRAVEVVGQERATRTAFVPGWTEHEVIDDELAAPFEEIGQRFRAVGSLDDD